MLGIGVLALSLTAIVMLSFTDDSYVIALGLVRRRDRRPTSPEWRAESR